jgi:hypothetical protein
MSEPNFEQVIRLANQLSQLDRLRLFHHLSELPDSGIHSGGLEKPPFELQVEEAVKKKGGGDSDDFTLAYTAPDVTPAWVMVLLKGKMIFQILYYPESFRESRLKLQSWQEAMPQENIKSEIREILSQAGMQRTEEEIVEALKASQREVYEAETYRISKELAVRLPDMAGLLVTAATKIIEISVRNTFAEQTGQVEKKTKLEDMEKMLEPFWKQIKERQLGVTTGGAHNVKHVWTDEHRACLESNYERLKPIWKEAKRIAVAAQKSKESTRSQRWQEEVKGTYPDLPGDLVERLSAPRSDEAKPADIALTHAARLCIPVILSLRSLRDELKELILDSPCGIY